MECNTCRLLSEGRLAFNTGTAERIRGTWVIVKAEEKQTTLHTGGVSNKQLWTLWSVKLKVRITVDRFFYGCH